MPVIEAKLGFFQIQLELVCAHPMKLSQPVLGVALNGKAMLHR
jgi:hypothetical protein